MRTCVALVVFALGLLVPLRAGPPMTTLRVEVKSLEGKPVDRAGVIVRFLEARSAVKLGKRTKTEWEVRTNQEGIAKIPPIPQGKIMVQVIAKGYQTYGATIEVDEEEKTVEVKLNPPQAPYSAHQ